MSGVAMKRYGFTPAVASQWGIGLIPLNNDKRPASRLLPTDGTGNATWKPFQGRRPTPDEVAVWISCKPAGFAAVTGAISGRISVDFDGDAGIETARKLGIAEDGPIVPHRRTPSGGLHCDFVHPGWYVKTQNHVSNKVLGARWPGLDCKGDGGYVGVWGRMARGEYGWLRDPEPYPLELLPEDLRADLGLLHAPDQESPLFSGGAQTRAKTPPAPLVEADALPPSVPRRDASTEGEHSVDPYLLIGTAFERIAGGLGRNDAGFWLACQFRDNGFPEAEARSFGPHFVSLVPATNTKGQVEPYTRRDYSASVRQAYGRPAREPWAASAVLIADDDPEAVESTELDGAEPEHQAVVSGVSAMEIGDHHRESLANTLPLQRVEEATRINEPGPHQPEPCGSDAGAQSGSEDSAIVLVDGEPESVAENDSAARPREPSRADEAKRRTARKILKDTLGMEIESLVKHGPEGGLFVIQLRDGRSIEIGKANRLIKESCFRIAVLDSLSQTLPRFKTGGWRKCLDALLALVEIREGVGADEMVHNWVESLLEVAAEAVESLSEPTEEVAAVFGGWAGGAGYDCDAIVESTKGGRVIIRLRRLHQFVMNRYGARLSEQDLGSYLSKIGFKKLSTLNGPIWNGVRLRTHRVWVTQKTLFPHLRLRGYQQRRFLAESCALAPPAERTWRPGMIDSAREGT